MAFASALHRDQRRKGTAIPYFSHLMAVAAMVIEAGGDEDQAIAGLLHDSVEDCGGLPTLDKIRRRYGDRVAGIVMDCTDSVEEPKPEWRPRKEAYIASLAHKSPDSLLVSLADKAHNLSCIARDWEDYGDAVWSRFNADRHEIIFYYQSLAEAFGKLLPGAASQRLAAAVADLSNQLNSPIADPGFDHAGNA